MEKPIHQLSLGKTKKNLATDRTPHSVAQSMSWIRSNAPTAISGQDNPEQGRRDLGGGDAQDSGQPRVERVAAYGLARATHLLLRLILVKGGNSIA